MVLSGSGKVKGIIQWFRHRTCDGCRCTVAIAAYSTTEEFLEFFMQNKKPNTTTNKYIFSGILVSMALTGVIGLTAANLSGFQIVGHTVAFAYPWRLTEPNAAAHLTAWAGYLLHN